MYFDSSATGVEHYRVRYTDDNKLTVDDDTYFENLTKLVEVGHYYLLIIIIPSKKMITFYVKTCIAP